MPLPFLFDVSYRGLAAIPYRDTLAKVTAWLSILYILKRYFGGARNRAERVMHSKVVMITVRT